MKDDENSIFSSKLPTHNGFQTSQQESVYNTVIFKVVQLLQKKCAEFLSQPPQFTTDNESFAIKMLKLFKVLKKLESNRVQEKGRQNISSELISLEKVLLGIVSNSLSVHSSPLKVSKVKASSLVIESGKDNTMKKKRTSTRLATSSYHVQEPLAQLDVPSS